MDEQTKRWLVIVAARVVDLALYAVGLALIWWAGGWVVALGVFIVLWALNFERRLDKYQ